MGVQESWAMPSCISSWHFYVYSWLMLAWHPTTLMTMSTPENGKVIKHDNWQWHQSCKLASCARLSAQLFSRCPQKTDSKSIGGFTISQLWRFQQAEPGEANSGTASQTAMDHAATLWKFTPTLWHSWPRHTLTKRRTLKAPVLPWYRPPNDWHSSNCSDKCWYCHGQRSEVYSPTTL